MREITLQELELPLQQMEMHTALRRLLLHLGGHADTRYTPGRYHFLTNVIKQRPALRAALLSDSEKQIQSEWLAALSSNTYDIRFIHGLAILYQEIVRANLVHPNDKLNDSIKIGTALWALLLCTSAFWSYFSPTRIAAADGEREALTAQQQKELLTATSGDLFSWHSREGRKAFAAGNAERARLHLLCLDTCCKGEKELKHLLDNQLILYPFAVDSQLIRQMASLAGQQLDVWCNSVLAEAERIATDPKEIEKLPAGVKQNYKGGIAALKPFIDLNIPVATVLLASLTYSNKWASDVHRELADTRYKASIVPFTALRPALSPFVRPAIPIADQLAALHIKDKGNVFKPEVREFGTHLYYRAVIAENDEKAVAICDEALTWEPESDWHQRLRHEFYSELFITYIKQITTTMKDRRKDAALLQKSKTFLQRIEKDATLQDIAQLFRLSLDFYQAHILAMDFKIVEAFKLARATHVAALAMNQPELAAAIQNFIRGLENTYFRR